MSHYSLTLQTAPSVEPVTTAEAKTFANISTSADDDLIDGLITAARKHCEDYVNRQFINATWDLKLESFPGEILIPKPPLSSVTSISYTDTNGDIQTLTAVTDYQVDTASEPGRIKPAYDEDWPSDVKEGVYDAVVIRFVAGYGTAGSNVPAEILLAIKMLVAHWYRFREPIVTGTTVVRIPMAVDALLWQYKVHEEEIAT